MTMALLGSWKIHSSGGGRVRESESESDVGVRQRRRRGVGGMNHIFLFVLLIPLSAVVPGHMDTFNDYNMTHVKINDTPGRCVHSGSLCPDADYVIKWEGNIISNTETGSVMTSSICQIKYP